MLMLLEPSSKMIHIFNIIVLSPKGGAAHAVQWRATKISAHDPLKTPLIQPTETR